MDFAAARRHMVESQVRTNDVTNKRLVAAFDAIPREQFLPPELRALAYVEREVDYAPGRRLLTARDLAKLIAVADPGENALVLNTVCGSGYSTAILAKMTGMVVSLESDDAICAQAQENLLALGLDNAAVITGDPVKGAADQGPYDFILIGGVIEIEPSELLAQLKDGGRLAAIKRIGGVSRGAVYTRSGDAYSLVEKFDAASRTPLIGFEAAKEFVF